MSNRHSGLVEFLADLKEQFGTFGVVARREQETEPASDFYRNDLPIIKIMVDESDNGICLVLASSEQESALKLEDFYQMLARQIEQHPDYSLVISDYFQIDDEHTGRVDLPLAGVEVDENEEALRLLF